MMQSLTKNALRRRLIVAGIGGGGGVLWSKPIVRTVILPAHAECSPCATMPTTTAGPVTERATVSSVTIMDGIAAGTDSTFTIQDRGTTSITKVTLALDLLMNRGGTIRASNGADMVITLASPDNTQVTLANRLRGSSGTCSNIGWDITLDDTALDDARQEAPLFTSTVACPADNTSKIEGTYRTATGLLAGFNGETPHGNWVLNVTDASGSGTSSERALGLSDSTLNSVLTVTSI